MKVVANGLHPAIQHRKAVLALSILDVALEQLAPVADKKLRARVDTVQRWTQGCWGPLRRKEASKGFQRDIKASVEALLDAFTARFGTGSEALAGWSAFYHVGLCLLWDARVASPLYTKSKAWSWLDRTAWGLGDVLMDVSPECDVVGTEIYEEVA